MKKTYNAVILFFATGMFVGYVPLAPGTFGSIVGAALYWAASMCLGVYQSLALFGVMLLAGTYAAGRAEKILGEQDSSRIVIDEVVGMYGTMLFIRPDLTGLLIGFLCFRAFDIVKPYPASYVDRNVHGGLGVMLDDVIAGIFANVTTHVLIFLYLLVRP
ncbi:MAG: phosphatidylglycerophosphatase A [Deltaproteobacteria bacterium]|nr:phosphatidylglycerophosphatase A [Deltaproteobacteria bacterium]MCL5276624.1 phosphatidylglycerophosphatase A [Deltaproteobacteria bacterium]